MDFEIDCRFFIIVAEDDSDSSVIFQSCWDFDERFCFHLAVALAHFNLMSQRRRLSLDKLFFAHHFQFEDVSSERHAAVRAPVVADPRGCLPHRHAAACAAGRLYPPVDLEQCLGLGAFERYCVFLAVAQVG